MTSFPSGLASPGALISAFDVGPSDGSAKNFGLLGVDAQILNYDIATGLTTFQVDFWASDDLVFDVADEYDAIIDVALVGVVPIPTGPASEIGNASLSCSGTGSDTCDDIVTLTLPGMSVSGEAWFRRFCIGNSATGGIAIDTLSLEAEIVTSTAVKVTAIATDGGSPNNVFMEADVFAGNITTLGGGSPWHLTGTSTTEVTGTETIVGAANGGFTFLSGFELGSNTGSALTVRRMGAGFIAPRVVAGDFLVTSRGQLGDASSSSFSAEVTGFGFGL